MAFHGGISSYIISYCRQDHQTACLRRIIDQSDYGLDCLWSYPIDYRNSCGFMVCTTSHNKTYRISFHTNWITIKYMGVFLVELCILPFSLAMGRMDGPNTKRDYLYGLCCWTNLSCSNRRTTRDYTGSTGYGLTCSSFPPSKLTTNIFPVPLLTPNRSAFVQPER